MVGLQREKENDMAASGEAFGENHPATLTYPNPTAEATRGHWFSLSGYGDHGDVEPTWVEEPCKGFRCADDPRDT